MRSGFGRTTAAMTMIVAAAVALAACASDGGAEAAPAAAKAVEAPAEAPSTTAPDPTPSQSEDETAVWVAGPASEAETETETEASAEPVVAEPVALDSTFETADGAMRLRMPMLWEIGDYGWLQTGGHEMLDWRNSVTISSPDGAAVIGYSDAPAAGEPQRTDDGEWGIVERRPVGDDLEAVAWWRAFDGYAMANVALAPRSDEDAMPGWAFESNGLQRSITASITDGTAPRSQQEAIALLRSEAAQTALSILETVELVDVGAQSFPESMLLTVDGETMLRYTTKNESASFAVPLDWRIEDRSGSFAESDGSRTWRNAVTLHAGEGGPSMHYSELPYWAESYDDGQDWSIGELRTVGDWHAGSWANRSTDSGWTWNLGVGLTDAADSARPTGRVCAEGVCRQFSSWLTNTEAGVDEPADWYASELEDTMLTVLGSLEVHHHGLAMPWW